MKIRFISLLLVIALSFGIISGCGSVSEEPEETETSQAASETSSEDTDTTDTEVPDEALEDVVYYLTEGLISSDDILFTIDGIDVSAAYYFYWLTYEAYLYSQSYYNVYYIYPDISQEFSDGTSMADLVTSAAYTYTVSYVCTYAHAIEAGIELSGDYLEAYETYYADSVYDLGEDLWDSAVYYGTVSEDDYTDEEKDAWINAYGETQMLLYLLYYSTTKDGIDDLYLYNNYFSQYRDYFYLEGGEYELSDDEIEDYVEEYDLYACTYILIGNSSSSDISDEEFEEYAALAESCAEELSALSGDDLEEAIEEYAQSYAAGNMCFSSSAELIEGSADVLAALETGQAGVSDQTDYGYYVLIREDVTRDTIITELEYSVEVSVAEMYFEEFVSEWMDEAEITDYGLLDEFDIYTYYENLEELRDIIDGIS